MAALINPISLGMRQSLLYRIPRTISVTSVICYVKVLSSSLPFCLFCAHSVSAAIILADRRRLRSAETKELSETRAMTGEAREQMGRIGGSLTQMSEGLREHLRGMNDSLRGMNDSLRGTDDSLRAITDDLREIGNNIEPCMDVGKFRSLGMEKGAEGERTFPGTQ